MNIFLSSTLDSNLKKAADFATLHNLNLEISRFGEIETLDNNFDALLEEAKEALKDFTGKLTLHGFFIDLNPACPDPKIKEATIYRYNQALKIARELKAQTIVFHSGYNGLVKHPVYHSNFLKESINFWKEFIKQFEETGIMAVLENTYENEPDIIIQIIDNVASPNFKMCIDTGHVNINSQYSVKEWIEKVGTRLHHMHLHNNSGYADEHRSIYNGTVDFNQVLDTLKNNNLNPDLVLEIFEKDAALESVDFIKNYEKNKVSN